MKLASTLVLSFIASAQAATTISSLVLPSGIPGYVTFSLYLFLFKNSIKTKILSTYRSSGLPFSTVSFDTTAATSVLSSLSSVYSAESSAVQSVLSSFTVTSPASSGSTSTSAPAATTSSAAGRTEAGLGLGLAAGAAAGFLGFVF
ncbi:hypothetical protein DFJ58DRAFT_789695 [Suillus subalutaceus]|uniref:uncharacterized protein n=1 Tax=Suillus subalutaceus TaxID=48586 RepID=UPI001B8871C5|nr:uncharacterized protein DFJ58DRAFT_789695 [Suillus subalutaceus]KAG1853146.1 hypothetical protein DFJ58DRAFT_789695 [Suillus subalutaceus]